MAGPPLGPRATNRSFAEIEVRVLGPVAVLGAARPFTRAGALELVVYLSMHPGGVRNDVWATALWPDRLMAPATVHSTASAARRSLGRRPGGGDHLPHGRGGLRLAESVTTDWHRLDRAAAGSDPRIWAAALRLVRGRPFDGLAGGDWVVLEGVAAEVEEGVAQLALRVAERYLRRGDGRRAAAAVRRGLRASPFDERLYRLLMMAADVEGNPAGVESAMLELLRLVGAPPGVGPPADVGLVHPQTASLYRSLSRRHPSSSRQGASGRALARL